MPASRDHAFHRYLAYRNYLDGVARLVTDLYPTDADLLRALAERRGYQVFKRQAQADPDAMGAILRHGWYTELLMRRTGQNLDLFPYAIPWSMVHAYYAIYRAMQVYFMISRAEVPTSHLGSLRTMSTELRSPSSPFPPPWSCLLDGDPYVKPAGLLHAPHCGPLTLSNPLKAHADPWQNYGLLLRTTRQRQLDEMVDNWKRSNQRRRITREERQRLVERLLPTSIFDALYRIRRRSNYQDTDSFIFSRVTDEQTIALHHDLCDIVYTTLLVFESLIARVTPPGWLGGVIEEFVEASGDPAASTVGARWEAVREHLGG